MSQENVEATRGARYRLSLPSEDASKRRSLDERLLVRLPGLYHLMAAAMTRLPPRSRLRRRILARNVSRACAAINRRDFDVWFLAYDPDIEYLPAREVVPPDMDAVVYGHYGIQGVWRDMIDSFEDFRAEPEELYDLGDTLLVTAQYVGHGSGSGVPIKIPLFQLFRLRRGLAIWQQDFSDRSEALEAAGLRE
jgi:ketosteroid isomerase-like protein